jgi:hypothetical protein
MLPGPFAYAERWDEKSDTYLGLAIERAASAVVVIDSDSVIVSTDVAEAHRPAPAQPGPGGTPPGPGDSTSTPDGSPADDGPTTPPAEKKPTRFTGAVMISPERPARDIHQIIEAIVEQLTTLPGSQESSDSRSRLTCLVVSNAPRCGRWLRTPTPSDSSRSRWSEKRPAFSGRSPGNAGPTKGVLQV